MTDIAIHVDGVGKQYQIGKTRKSKRTMREVLVDGISSPLRRLSVLFASQAVKRESEDATIWALKDVSFDIARGSVVGIIGRNGAGKSTLLKILSRITEPTEGYADIHGRVGSLLEVGTGFHQELTGRENIYLNGAILGMRSREIERKFDEIIAFAEVSKFIDTPVKHYSSGMRLRLGFAVAAHLEPEILLVDEVLAVGDARFQKKCINKMQDVGQQGRTVLFVSHNMPAITRLCERTILLDAGQLVQDGPSHEVVGHYLNAGMGTTAAREWPDPATAPGGEVARLCAVRVRDPDQNITEAIDIRVPVAVELEYEVRVPGHVLMPYFDFFNDEGVHVFTAIDQDPDWRRRARPTGRYTSKAYIPGNLLSEGTLIVNAVVVTLEPNTLQFYERDAVAFQVIDSLDGDSARGDWAGRMRGIVRPMLEWETEFRPNGQHLTP
jgi:lipopolysaccharide transport system ATP-binding protein